MVHSVIVKEKDSNETLQQILDRIEEQKPKFRRILVTKKMRHEAAVRDMADRRKLGDDY